MAAMKALLHVILAAGLLGLTGCGSMTARWRGERGGAYPGVKMDAEHATRYSTEGEWIALFDIPLSAVLDTIMLPYDLGNE
jgi:uncharacterized protein YceK